MTIIDIARQIELTKGQRNTACDSKPGENSLDWTPVKCDDYVVPQFQIPKSRSQACTKSKLSKVLAFISMAKSKRLSQGCTIMPIATTEKRLVQLCGSQQNVSNLIKFMIQVGLLEVESLDYQFNADKEEYNKSKTYRYYHENEEKIERYCEEQDIHKYEIKNNIRDTVVQKFTITDIDKKRVLFNSKLCLKKPDGYSKAQFEAYLTAALYERYPGLGHYQELADSINDTYYADEPNLKISLSPRFTWGKKNDVVKKIGIRATNRYVSAKKVKKQNARFHGKYKEDILQQYRLNLEKDVTSSVPRITLSLNTGRWISEDVDIYELIYDQCITLKMQTGTDPTVVQKFSDVRSAIKTLHMRCYFDDDRYLVTHTWKAMGFQGNKEEINREMHLLQNAVVSAEGGTLYDNEVFFHESCIYMDVLKELLDNGFRVWQCYDAWYAAKDGVTQSAFEEYMRRIVEEKANPYIARYITSG